MDKWNVKDMQKRTSLVRKHDGPSTVGILLLHEEVKVKGQLIILKKNSTMAYMVVN